jgi:hypothetical protein
MHTCLFSSDYQIVFSSSFYYLSFCHKLNPSSSKLKYLEFLQFEQGAICKSEFFHSFYRFTLAHIQHYIIQFIQNIQTIYYILSDERYSWICVFIMYVPEWRRERNILSSFSWQNDLHHYSTMYSLFPFPMIAYRTLLHSYSSSFSVWSNSTDLNVVEKLMLFSSIRNFVIILL